MPLFTKESAASYGKKGALARWAPKPTPPEPPPVAELVPEPNYNLKRLSRVRKQIDQLSTMLEEESEPQSIDRLASAISRLSEIERQLSGRPLPGTLQPGREKPARLMLSPAVDAGHAQSPATPTQSSQPASDPPSDSPPAENS